MKNVAHPLAIPPILGEIDAHPVCVYRMKPLVAEPPAVVPIGRISLAVVALRVESIGIESIRIGRSGEMIPCRIKSAAVIPAPISLRDLMVAVAVVALAVVAGEGVPVEGVPGAESGEMTRGMRPIGPRPGRGESSPIHPYPRPRRDAQTVPIIALRVPILRREAVRVVPAPVIPRRIVACGIVASVGADVAPVAGQELPACRTRRDARRQTRGLRVIAETDDGGVPAVYVAVFNAIIYVAGHPRAGGCRPALKLGRHRRLGIQRRLAVRSIDQPGGGVEQLASLGDDLFRLFGLRGCLRRGLRRGRRRAVWHPDDRAIRTMHRHHRPHGRGRGRRPGIGQHAPRVTCDRSGWRGGYPSAPLHLVVDRRVAPARGFLRQARLAMGRRRDCEFAHVGKERTSLRIVQQRLGLALGRADVPLVECFEIRWGHAAPRPSCRAEMGKVDTSVAIARHRGPPSCCGPGPHPPPDPPRRGHPGRSTSQTWPGSRPTAAANPGCSAHSRF